MIVAYATKGLTYVCLSGGSKVDDFSVVSVEGEQRHKYRHQTNQRQDWNKNNNNDNTSKIGNIIM